MLTGVIAGTVGAFTTAPAEAVSGTAGGRVFRDFNANGAFDTATSATSPAVDTGLAGVTVRAYDKDNNVVATAQTAANGTYSLSYNTSTATANVRLEFDTPTGMVSSRAGVSGATSDTDVQFVGTGTTNADLALSFPQDFAPANPNVAFARQVGAIKLDGTAQNTDAGTIFTNTFNTRGTTTANPATKEATVSQTGSVWGVTSLDDSFIFSAAYFKRHAAVGPGGLGQIYLTTVGGATDASAFATVANVGTNPRPAGITTAQYFNDTTSYAQIGKIGLGGMTIAPDHSALYVVNLAARTLVRIPITINSSGVPVAGTQTSVAIPGPTCAGNLRPFGVSAANGSLWVTQTCAATSVANQRGYVYQYDYTTNTFNTTPVLDLPLTGAANRGFAYSGNNQTATWRAWNDSTGTDVWATSGTTISYPQPLVSDVQFDANGDMTVGIKDRFGDQSGFAGSPAGGNGVYEGMAAGDTLRACLNTAGAYVLESNAVCGSRTGYGAGNGDGPGGGEFYSDDFNGGSHDQVSLGGLLQVPGFPTIISTTYDPKSPGSDPEYGTNGYRFWSNTNGSFDVNTGWRQVGLAVRNTTSDGRESNYGKAGGMGDLDLLVKVPVEIGNRVWIDTDRDGIQEPGEPAVSGVQVALVNAAGTVVGTTTTSASGEYYFNDTNVTGGLVAGAAYKIRLQRAADFTGTGALADYGLTTTGAGTKDKIDSDATIVGSYPEIAITAPRFGADHSYDFGFVRKAVSVGDFIWNDVDRDGIQDAGEPGIPGVVVTITGPGGAAVTNVFGTAVTSATTDANGKYSFPNLPALPAGSSYTVSVDNNQTALTAAGYTPTTANAGSDTAIDSSTGSATSGNLTTNGATDHTLDFGFAKKAVSVGDFVWVDSNRDGIQTAGEPGIAGVVVTITKADGTAVTNVNGASVTSTTTDANGKYSFDLLPAGVAYKVTINPSQTALSGYIPTITGAGTAATDSSNGSATSAVLANNGDQDLTLDFGFVKPAVSIGDFVWADTNRNGIQDAGEPGISGVTLTVTRTDGATVKNTLGATVTSTTTDGAGKYTFPNLEALPSGVFYKVSVDNSQAALAGAGFVPTLTGAGTAATDSSNGSATSGALTTNGATDHTLDFGFVKKAVSVGDFVWVDTNKNGIQDAGELGIPGVTVTITKADGTAVTNVNGTAVTSVVTDANGKYTFDLLPAGVAYKVSINNAQTALADYVPTITGAGTTATDSSNGTVTSVVLANNGDSDTTLDFGFRRKTVSVGDFVWVDTNRNGIQDAGEPGINNVTVTITRTDGAPVKKDNGTVVTSTTTNTTGAYSFSDLEALPAGVFYKVSIDNTQAALAAYVPTLTGQGTTATDSSTGSATSGALTNDGASDFTLDFGFVKPAVTVGDFVWFDANGNGTQDAGESGIPGVTVTITKADGTAVTDVNGNPVTSATTDAAGKYTFGLLPAGVAYKVSVDNNQAALFAYVPTLTGQGTAATDSSTGSATTAVLNGNGTTDLTLDFGFVKKKVSVGDFVWIDTNRDGLQTAGEPGIQGVTVTITRTDGGTVRNVAGTAVTSTTTDASGKYLFGSLEALPAGVHYKTAIDNTQAALSAYVPTLAGVGTNNAIDSSTGTSESGNLTTDGASDLTLDYGFVRPAVSVGDFVWFDANGNGIQDAGEAGIPGVVVTITKADGSPVTNVNGTAITSVTTDANGKYTFDLLPAGVAYKVSVDNGQAALFAYVPTLTGQGTAATDSSNGTVTSAVLAANGASDTTLDFGFRKKAVSVGDFVWVDTNRDGLQNAGEPGISGAAVTITRTDGATVKTVAGATVTSATTDANGKYTFANLEPLPSGTHYVTAVSNTQPALAAYVPTLAGVGTDRAVDSSTSTSESGNLTTDGASDLTLDFGFVKPAVTVGDYVFVDANGNGIQDAGDTGLSGVTVTIKKADGTAVVDVNGNPVVSTVTGANGQYTFPLLPAGVAYTVSVDATQAALFPYVATLANQGADTTKDSSTGSATSAVVTANGGSDLSLDFGFVKKKVSVGDFVWVDTNRNGLQNSGEPGISGVTVTITRTDGATVKTIGGTTVTSTTTDSFGKYVFANLEPLPAGTHYVTAVSNGQAALSAYIPTLAGVGTDRAIDSSTSSSESGNLTTDGAADLTLDFGFVKPAVSVGDTVFADTNGNGVQNAGEPGIPGVTVTITAPGGGTVTDVNGNPVGPQTTDGNGNYLFPLLPALPAGQSYTVVVDPAQPALAGYTPTNNPGATGPLTTNGASDLTVDFGFKKKAVSVGDFIWVDANRDGLQTAGEPGIQGVTVTITRTDGTPVKTITGTTVTTAVTDSAGKYLFSNLESLATGVFYTVTVNNGQAALAGYVPTLANQGADTSKDSSTGTATSGALTTDGASDLTLDFGFVKPAVKVGDFVWFDQNGNGIQDAGEAGIAGVTVRITYADGTAVTDVNGNPVTTVVTGSNGQYTFDLLPSGKAYTVTIDNDQAALNNYAPTQTGQGTPATDSSNGTYTTGVLTGNGASDITADFGFKAAAAMILLDKSAGALVDNDNNGPDAGDTITYSFVVTNTGNRVLTNIQVNDPLFPGANPNISCGTGPLAVGASRTCTPVTYTLTQADVNNGSVNNTATVKGTSPAGTVVTSTDGTSTATFPQAVSVGDFVWVDTDRDGIQDAGEPGIQGVKLTIVGPTGNPVNDVNGNPVGEATTNANGRYLFVNLPILPAGQHYTVKVDNTQAALAPYVATLAGVGTDRAVDSSNSTSESGNLTSNGASDLTLDFGFVKPAVTVGDYVFVDANGNGIQDAGDTGLSGVTVTIKKADGTAVVDVNGNPVVSTVTGANGQYTFPLLPAGVAYTVSVDNTQAALAAYVPTLTGQGTPATDSSNGTYTTPVLTGNGASDLTADFGFKAAAPAVKLDKTASSINDLDGNGPDAGDTITYSFVVTNTGNVVLNPVQVNDPLFPGAAPNVTCGTGPLAVNASRTCTPRTYTLTQADINAGSRANTATVQGTAPNGAVVSNNASTTTPIVPIKVSVGDFVWVDTNRDGLQTAGEPGINGVTVTITRTDGAPVVNAAGATVTSTTTNASGKYLFADLQSLPAGTHYVTAINNGQAALAAYVPTLAGVGTDRAIDSSTSTSESGNLTTNGASDLTLDYGFVKPAVSVGDFIWSDTNGNGIQDAGEPGIPNVVVKITDTNGNPVTDVNGNPVGSQTTGANGQYTFPLLPAGVAYIVTVDNTQAALAGYVPTLTGQGTPATDSSNGTYTTPVLTGNGASDLTADFGFKAAAPMVKLAKTASAINDLDGNGPDAGDTVTYGFTVTNTGNVVLNPVTVNDPLFPGAKPNITCGTGPLAVAASRTCTPRTYTLTQADVNAGSVLNTATASGTAPNGQVVTSNDSTTTTVAPVKVSVGDFVWVDTNRNGIQNAGEPGISGVTVTITRTDGAPVVNAAGATVTSTTTNANGKYLFADLQSLPAGTHYVTAISNGQAALAAYVPTLAGVGTDRSVDSSTSTSESGNLTTNGASDLTLDFGFVKPAVTVGDFVWVDTNGNGIQDANEPGISGVTVTIKKADGTAVTDVNGNPVTSATTDANGKYTFGLLPAGVAYTVSIDNTQAALAAYVPTLANQGGDTSVDSSTGSYTTPVLNGNGASDLTADFGFKSVAPAIVLDKTASAINDLDGNGPDAGDTIVYSFVVTNTGNVVLNPVTVNDPLFPGANPNITCGSGPLAVAASRTCTPRTYTLTQADINAGSVVNTATAQGTAPNGTVVSSTDGTITPVNPQSVSVGDFVWVDTDRDGIQDAGENGIQGVKLTIVGPTGNPVTDIYGNPVGAATTNAGGAYLFTNLPVLPAGQHYTVKIDNTQAALATYVPTLAGQGTDPAKDSSTSSAESGNLTTNGASDLTLDFGFVKSAVSVGDTVFADTNGNGVQNAGEPGIPGVTVTITAPGGGTVTDVNGNPVGPQTTNGNGNYLFPLLPALPAGQSYTVVVNPNQPALAGYTPTNNPGATGPLTTNGASDLTVDFGFTKNRVSVGDFVWVDTNRNGIQNAGEPGLPGVTVTITKANGDAVVDVNGNPVGPQVTDANGAYLFTNLPEGTYKVSIDNNQAALAAYVPTLTGQGTTATDSSTGSATSAALTGNGASDRTLDFGFVKPAVSVGDYVFVDNNGNGIQDAGDAGLPGVVLTIVGPGGNPVSDVYGNTVGPVTSGSNGQYVFTNLPALPAGQSYTVKVDNTQPALAAYTPAPTGQGTPATDSSNGSGQTGNLTTNGASDTTVDFGFVPNNPSVRLDKTASSINDLDGNGPDAGDTITYGFKVTNTGNATLTNVTVTDPKFPTAITCSPTTLAPGASVTCSSKTYTLTADDVATGRVDNTAKVTGTTPTGGTVTDTDSTTTPVVPVTGKANVKITKTVDKATPAVGDEVTYTLRAENTGDADADNVVVSDTLPTQVTYVSSDAPGTFANGVVSFNLGTLSPGEVRTVKIKVTVDNAPAGTTQERHQIDIQKQEVVLDVEPGQTASTTVSCQPDSTVLDGSARVVSSGANVAILENRAVSLSTWKVTLKNLGTDRAQNKAFIVCAKNETETVNGHSHQLQVPAAAVTQTVALPAGRTNVTLSCATGTTPVQPGWLFDGAARVVTSYPLGTSSWVFGVDNPVTGGASNGTFAIRCLNNQTSTVAGHSHDLELAGLYRTVTVPAGQTVDLPVDCADSAIGNQGAKGIVAGFNLANGLTVGGGNGASTGVVSQGNEPQPIRRVFTLTNPTSGDLTADLYLLCLSTKTAGHDGSGTVVNTATVSTTSPERTTNDNSSTATFKVTGVVTPDAPKTNLQVAKSVDNVTPRVGDNVTYTLKVTNNSSVAAEDTVLTDPLPNGVTFVSASAPGSLSGSTVSWDLGTLAAGATRSVTLTVKVGSAPAAGTAHDHVIDVQKVEVPVTLAPGQTKSATADCAPGYLATDGSGRIDQIDQGTGTPDAVRIIRSAAADEDSWTATFVNTATGQARGKVFAVCTKKTTDAADGHAHDLVYSAPVATTQVLNAGSTTVDLDCGPGTRPIAPSFSVPADATVRQTRPSGSTRWTFVVDSASAGSGDFSIRCLSDKVATADGHQHDLSLTPISQTLTVAPGQTVEVTNSCGDAKGIVAGYFMEKGLVSLGNDPRPVVRVFRFYNPTNTAKEVTVHTLCLATKTSANTGSGTVKNTAYATTFTPETTTGDNTASASFKVNVTPIATPASTTAAVAPRAAYVSTDVKCATGSKACTGSVVLVARSTQKVDGRTVKKGATLARGTYQVASGRIVKVKLTSSALGKKVLASPTLKTATVKVVGSSRNVRLAR